MDQHSRQKEKKKNKSGEWDSRREKREPHGLDGQKKNQDLQKEECCFVSFIKWF